MTEPNKHRAEPKHAITPPETPDGGGLSEQQAAQIRQALSGAGKRASSPRSGLSVAAVLAWFRTTPGLIVFAVIVLGAALGVRLLVGGDDEPSGNAKAGIPGAANATYGDQWRTVDGSLYEVSIETLSDLAQGGSDGGSGCLPAPPPGTTNLRFRVIITNRSDREVEVPRMDFGTDVVRGGTVAKKMPTFAKSNKQVVITPLVAGAPNCRDAARLGTVARDRIPVGGAAEFFGAFGPLKLPVSTRPTVIYRFYADDNGKPQPHDLLAPFGTLPAS